jgi:hypothetical protein
MWASRDIKYLHYNIVFIVIYPFFVECNKVCYGYGLMQPVVAA